MALASDVPLRRCSVCRRSALCRAATETSVNLVSTGTRYDYECTGCRATFRIESVYGITLSSLGAPLFGALGAVVLGARHLPAAGLGIGAFFVLLSVLSAGRATWSLVSRLRHPVIG